MSLDIRYKKNLGNAFDEKLQESCLNKTVAVVGAGGCGGYVLEHFARLGVKKIIIFDGDNFEYSNLNRQRFCDAGTIHCNKASSARETLRSINDSIEIIAVEDYFSEKYIDLILSSSVDIIIHAADCYRNAVELNDGLTKCLSYRIPIIKVSLYTSRATAAFINPRYPSLWFKLKGDSVKQSTEGPCEYISALSHYCAISSCLALELFLNHLQCAETPSCFLSYEYNTMTTNLRLYD